MNHTFFKRHTTDPRRGNRRGGREYDENGIPVEGLPANERPVYENDERPFSLRGEGGGAEQNTPRTGLHNGQSDEAQQPPAGAVTPDNADAPELPAESGRNAPTVYDLDEGLTQYYDRLYERLQAYGVTSIPTLEALYGLFESFLRPSIEEAIRQRRRQGETNMAELDADAYSRGMGGSSFLSSVKAREQDDIADDVMGLEAKYSANMAEYLYKALTAMQELEASLAKTAMQYAGSSGSGRSGYGSGRSGSSASASASAEEGGYGYGHTKNGAYFDGVWYEGDFSYLENPSLYNDYARYIAGLTPGQVYLLFTSNKREWRMRRWQMQYNLPQVDYNELYDTYFVLPTGGGGGGSTTWQQMLY